MNSKPAGPSTSASSGRPRSSSSSGVGRAPPVGGIGREEYRAGRSTAGELRFQLGPTRVEAVDVGLALVDGGEQGDQLGGVAGVLGALALHTGVAQRGLGARDRLLDGVVLALILV